MDEIRCPMCGKPNPADQDICQYCQARLKPLRIQPSSGEQQSSTGDQERLSSLGDLEGANWLDSLRSSEETSQGGETDLPDWMEDVQDEEQGEAPEPDQRRGDESTEWLESLRRREQFLKPVDQETAEASEADWYSDRSSEDEEESDWLANMRSGGFGPLESKREMEEEAAQTPGEDSDWLKLIQERQREQSQAEDQAAEFPEDQPEGQPEEKPEDQPEDQPVRLAPIEEQALPAESPPSAPSRKEGLLDWLAPEEQETSETAQQAEQIPGWLASSETGPAQGLPTIGPDDEETPEWLARGRRADLQMASSPEDQAFEQAQQEPEAGAADQLPGEEMRDLLAGMNQPPAQVVPEESEEEAEAVTSPEESAQPMLDNETELEGSDLAGLEQEPALAQPEAEELSDWTQPVGEGQAGQVEFGAGQPVEPGLEEDAGLVEQQEEAALTEESPAASEETAPPTAEVPEITEVEAASTVAVEQETGQMPGLAPSSGAPAGEKPATGNLVEGAPDWLEELSKPEDADLLDWLREAEEEEEEGYPGAESGASYIGPKAQAFSADADQARPAEDIPEWLAAMQASAGGEIRESGELVQKPEEEAEEQASQDWLADLEAEEDETAILDTTSLPDWLVEPEEEKPPAEAEEPAASILGEGFSVQPTEEDDLSWLQKLEAAAPDLPYETVESEEAKSGAAPALPSGEGGEEPAALPASDLPDWLSSITPQKGATEGGALSAEEIEAAGLARAELPSWLEAMRPVDSAAVAAPPVDRGSDQVESAGPLAGLRGVLPAEPDVARIRKPSAYSVKLQVSEEQQADAALLEKLVEAEEKPRPIPAWAGISAQHVLRWVIAAALFVAILWPLILNSPQVSLPAFSPEVGSANQLVNEVPAGAPVLVAVDYEAGWSGEMDAAANAVISHLKLRGAYLALVSTTPTGPIQAERLLSVSAAQGARTSWEPGSQYENLGFIPGGPAGLLSFAITPRQVMPSTLDQEPAWSQGPLQNVQSLADFALTLLITENPDTARMWIEQVQPYLKDKPLVMVISAQAEPLVRPYYEAGAQQVNGIIAGLAGGAAYENLNGDLGLGRTYWNAFSLSLVAASLLIFAGGVANAISAYLARRKEEALGEARS